jgi:hypothetical protein
MKLSSLRYLLREGFRNIWQNRFMSIASIGVLICCLLFTGSAYLVFANIDHFFDWVYGQNVVVVFADIDATEEQTAAMGEAIRGITNVQSVEFVSKDEALWEMADDLPKNTFEEMQGENNPLQDSFIVSLRDLSQLDATVMQLQKLDKVEDVTYNGDIAETLTRIKQVVMAVMGWIIVMLLLVSLFIIANTIKLTVYNRRLEIYIMKSVGATNGFIRLPFIIEGAVLGLVSGLLSFGIIAFLYNKMAGISIFNESFSLLKFSAVWVVLFVGFLVAGTLTGIAGSAISMTKYLKDEGGSQS